MLKRYLLAIVLAWTGIMVAAAPVAAMAMMNSINCATIMKSEVPETHHAHVSHDMSDMHGQVAPGAEKKSLQTCCDHACLSDAATTLELQNHPMREGLAILDWSVKDRTDLATPTGLRRPPKA